MQEFPLTSWQSETTHSFLRALQHIDKTCSLYVWVQYPKVILRCWSTWKQALPAFICRMGLECTDIESKDVLFFATSAMQCFHKVNQRIQFKPSGRVSRRPRSTISGNGQWIHFFPVHGLLTKNGKHPVMIISTLNMICQQQHILGSVFFLERLPVAKVERSVARSISPREATVCKGR